MDTKYQVGDIIRDIIRDELILIEGIRTAPLIDGEFVYDARILETNQVHTWYTNGIDSLDVIIKVA